ncbi:hypothetical protein BD560DRAFT_419330 [Blakeslea trispora]|nr:hypothetical protein BD560DRAFT_419330 [Blakeslea trispora]
MFFLQCLKESMTMRAKTNYASFFFYTDPYANHYILNQIKVTVNSYGIILNSKPFSAACSPPMSQTQQPDTSLRTIYSALKNANNAKSIQYKASLAEASTLTIDHILRRVLGYAKQSENKEWPPYRLAQILNLVFSLCFKNDRMRERIGLASFKASLRWAIELLSDPNQDATTARYTLKFVCTVLESIDHSAVSKSLLFDFKNRQGVKHLVRWLQYKEPSIQFYSLCAINVQCTNFIEELNQSLDLYTFAISSMSNIPSILETLLTAPNKDMSEYESQLKQHMQICQLLKSMFKHSAPEKLCEFIDSVLFRQLAQVWCAVCQYEYLISMREEASMSSKSPQKLLYLLCSIIHSCTTTSRKAASCISEEQLRAKWQPVLALMMQRWIYDTCCTMNTPVCTPESLKVSRFVMGKMLQISLDVVPVLQHHMYWLDYVDQAVCDLVNFIMAYVSQPILPEHATTIGKPNTVLHTNLCIDVEERNYQFDAKMMQENQDLFVLILESLIQHIQLASNALIELISGRAAWCLKSIATVLFYGDQLNSSPLRSRMMKLNIFFLHYGSAIEVFATSTTNITPFIWGPTIDLAKQGLLTATTLSADNTDLSAEVSTVVYKAKRAFVSLEKISSYHRACERLVDCDVFQLVDISLVPEGRIIEKASLLTMYAQYGRFLAVLSRRTAFVRTKLRDQYHLFPITLKLLNEAVELKEKQRLAITEEGLDDHIYKGWNQLISSCLMLVSSFQYDETSMNKWLCYKQEEQDGTNRTSSVLPLLLDVLFPWRKQTSVSQQKEDTLKYIKSDLDVMKRAAQLLDQLSYNYLCGRQIIKDTSVLSNLSTLMICLAENEQHLKHIDDAQHSDAMSNPRVDDDKRELLYGKSEIEGSSPSTTEPETALPIEENEKDEKACPAIQCANYLKRSAIRILISHENIQINILSDVFTSFFRPMIQHPSMGAVCSKWRHAICDELFEKRMPDFQRLYEFTDNTDEAIKLHDFTAVAVAYLAMGAPSSDEWNVVLGLNLSKNQSVTVTRNVFGMLCQMLVFELEYEEEDYSKEEEEDTKMAEIDDLLGLVTPLRRHAAAQVIEALSLELELIWLTETNSIQEKRKNSCPIQLENPSGIVTFMTDDLHRISGHRQLLCARSPIFEALLSGDYAETQSTDAIPIRDVSFHSLKLFIDTIHQLNQENTNALDQTSWQDIVELLKISDRFGSTIVKDLCEDWVIEKVRHITLNKDQRMDCLEGMMRLYRQCRDPIEKDAGISSDTWPFATVLRESLKAIIQYMSESSQTQTFLEMVKEKNVEELDAFCDSAASLLRK